MLIVRGTKKLRDRVKAPLADGSTCRPPCSATGSPPRCSGSRRSRCWSTANFCRCSCRSHPRRPCSTGRPTAIAAVLRRAWCRRAFLAAERKAMREVRIAPTNDRSVVGVMNEFAFHGEFALQRGHGSRGPLARNGPDADRPTPRPQRLSRPRAGGRRSADRTASQGDRRSPAPTTHAPSDCRHRRTLRWSTGRSVYQLKVTLLDTKPPVWRRVLVDGSARSTRSTR